MQAILDTTIQQATNRRNDARGFFVSADAPVLTLAPCTIKAARAFIAEHHRHHRAPQGALFAVAVRSGGTLVGVATVGRPVARMLDDGQTAEVTRVAVLPDYFNACSMLYGACRRAAKALGYTRILTYILKSEAGTSLKASGWTKTALVRGNREWDTPSRRRRAGDVTEHKSRWECSL